MSKCAWPTSSAMSSSPSTMTTRFWPQAQQLLEDAFPIGWRGDQSAEILLNLYGPKPGERPDTQMDLALETKTRKTPH